MSQHQQRVGGINDFALAQGLDKVYMVSVGQDRSLSFWDLMQSQPLQIVPGAHVQECTCVALSRDGVLATGSADQTVKLWDRDGETARRRTLALRTRAKRHVQRGRKDARVGRRRRDHHGVERRHGEGVRRRGARGGGRFCAIDWTSSTKTLAGATRRERHATLLARAFRSSEKIIREVPLRFARRSCTSSPRALPRLLVSPSFRDGRREESGEDLA